MGLIAQSDFMSSKNAIYESSILSGLGADEEFIDSCFTTVGAAVGRVVAATDDRDDFGFTFGTSRLSPHTYRSRNHRCKLWSVLSWRPLNNGRHSWSDIRRLLRNKWSNTRIIKCHRRRGTVKAVVPSLEVQGEAHKVALESVGSSYQGEQVAQKFQVQIIEDTYPVEVVGNVKFPGVSHQAAMLGAGEVQELGIVASEGVAQGRSKNLGLLPRRGWRGNHFR